MRQRLRTLAIWIILLATFSSANVLANVSLAAAPPPRTFSDTRLYSYNFTMTVPTLVKGSFSTPVAFDVSPDQYSVSAHVWNAFNLSSISALGQYGINYTISDNNVKVRTGSFSIDWSHEPWSLSASGPEPFGPGPFNLTNFHMGTNILNFDFTIYSRLTKYGQGFYQVNLGPLTVNTTSLPKSTTLPIVLEIVAALLLIPVSHLVSFVIYKSRRRENLVARIPSALKFPIFS